MLQEQLLALATVPFCEDHTYVEHFNKDNIFWEDGQRKDFDSLNRIENSGFIDAGPQ